MGNGELRNRRKVFFNFPLIDLIGFWIIPAFTDKRQT